VRLLRHPSLRRGPLILPGLRRLAGGHVHIIGGAIRCAAQRSAPPSFLCWGGACRAETRIAYKQRTLGTLGPDGMGDGHLTRYKVSKLLIESKASGISAAQELRNWFGYLPFSVQLCPVKGDKFARALAVQSIFSQEMVYAPNKDWAELVLMEMSMFPIGKYDDLTDSATQALN